MRWDQLGTHNFLAFDVGLDIREAASLVHEFKPTYLVLRDVGSNRFDPTDSVYYFVRPELFEWDQSTAPDEGVTIADRFELRFGQRAEVVDMASDPVVRPWRHGVTTTGEVVVLGPGGAVASVVSSIGNEVDRALEAARWGDTGALDLLDAVRVESEHHPEIAGPTRRRSGKDGLFLGEGDGGDDGDGGPPGEATVALKSARFSQRMPAWPGVHGTSRDRRLGCCVHGRRCGRVLGFALGCH